MIGHIRYICYGFLKSTIQFSCSWHGCSASAPNVKVKCQCQTHNGENISLQTARLWFKISSTNWQSDRRILSWNMTWQNSKRRPDGGLYSLSAFSSSCCTQWHNVLKALWLTLCTRCKYHVKKLHMSTAGSHVAFLSFCSLALKLLTSVRIAPGTISGIPTVLELVSTTESGSMVVWLLPSLRRDASSSSSTRTRSLCVSRWPGTSDRASFKSVNADSYCLYTITSLQNSHHSTYINQLVLGIFVMFVDSS